jgi:toxin ParE1/3/4
MPQLIVTGPARRDIAAIIRWSVKHFGEQAALRYEDLILQAMRDVAADPERPGTATRPDLMVEGARTFHLSFSRVRTSEPRVRTPRHLLLYRCDPTGVIVVARVLHDARDLARHLPPDYRR